MEIKFGSTNRNVKCISFDPTILFLIYAKDILVYVHRGMNKDICICGFANI